MKFIDLSIGNNVEKGNIVTIQNGKKMVNVNKRSSLFLDFYDGVQITTPWAINPIKVNEKKKGSALVTEYDSDEAQNPIVYNDFTTMAPRMAIRKNIKEKVSVGTDLVWISIDTSEFIPIFYDLNRGSGIEVRSTEWGREEIRALLAIPYKRIEGVENGCWKREIVIYGYRTKDMTYQKYTLLIRKPFMQGEAYQIELSTSTNTKLPRDKKIFEKVDKMHDSYTQPRGLRLSGNIFTNLFIGTDTKEEALKKIETPIHSYTDMLYVTFGDGICKSELLPNIDDVTYIQFDSSDIKETPSNGIRNSILDKIMPYSAASHWSNRMSCACMIGDITLTAKETRTTRLKYLCKLAEDMSIETVLSR